MLKELLGAGQYGRVFAAEDRQSGVPYAVKSIPKSIPGLDPRTLANYRDKIRREVDTQIALVRARQRLRPSVPVGETEADKATKTNPSPHRGARSTSSTSTTPSRTTSSCTSCSSAAPVATSGATGRSGATGTAPVGHTNLTPCAPPPAVSSRARRDIVEGHFDEAKAAEVVRVVLRTIAQCHAKGVAFRDVKPENFMYSSPDPAAPLKLSDFGLAVPFHEGQKLTERCGTIYYVAPEVIAMSYGKEADLWSAGVVAYQLLSGRLPFTDKVNDRPVNKEARARRGKRRSAGLHYGARGRRTCAPQSHSKA